MRTALIRRRVIKPGKVGFKAVDAEMALFSDPEDGDVARTEFSRVQGPWKVGPHFFLSFPESNIWQSHSFTPLSLLFQVDDAVRHGYVFGAKSGETKGVADLVASKQATSVIQPVLLTPAS